MRQAQALRCRVERFLGDGEALDAPRSIAGRVELEDLPAGDVLVLRQEIAQAPHIHMVLLREDGCYRYLLPDALHPVKRAHGDMEAPMRAHMVIHRFLVRVDREVEDVD